MGRAKLSLGLGTLDNRSAKDGLCWIERNDVGNASDYGLYCQVY